MVPFPATRQSVLERVRSQDADVRRLAFGDLAEGYWKPSYHYLRLHWHLTPEAAEDAVQGFFTTAFEKQYLERYDGSKARFRTFLRVCLDRFVQNAQKAEHAGRRGGGAATLSLDFPGAEREVDAISAANMGDLDRFFHDETVRFLFARAVEALRVACERDGRTAIFEVFEHHDLKPSADASYATVAAQLGLTVGQVTNHLHAARRMFRELALAKLKSISATDEEYRREARDIFGIILGAVLGAFDGFTAMFSAPETTPDIMTIVAGSTVKGLIVGAIVGWYSSRVRSLAKGLLVGLVVAAFFAFLIAMMPNPDGGHYWVEIMVPGSIVGLIVGYATQTFGKTKAV